MKFIQCPCCSVWVEVVEENCGIFRCGVYKETGQQLPPHASKEECLNAKPHIWGCASPFQIINDKITVCDYI
jgi:hypothetical protein